MSKLRVLDLFSGIGGFSLGLERTGGFETVAFCEIEEYPRKVLAKHWPGVPIHKDIRELDKKDLPNDIRLICGGYPCQPFSLAGKRGGEKDARHLWPEVDRLILAIEPDWVFFENVYGHISMGLDEVLSDLEAAGYTAEVFVIPACAVDAPHRRDRTWIVAYRMCQGPAHGQETQKRGQRESGGNPLNTCGQIPNVANSGGAGLQGHAGNGDSGSKPGRFQAGKDRPTAQSGLCERKGIKPAGEWPTEPGVGRVANGVPSRVDRLKCLGNAVVPQIPELIGRAILSSMTPLTRTAGDRP